MSGHSNDTLSHFLRALTDEEVRTRLLELVRQERENVADVIEHLMEIDHREAALDWGYPSLFAYCLKALGYSEAAAYTRIRAARAAVRFPDLLGRLRSGRIHLDALARLAPYLTEENRGDLLEKADGASKKDVLSLVATLQSAPPPERDVVVPVPPATPSPRPPEASPPIEIIPPAPHRFHFTADGELLRLVERLRGLLRHKYPGGRLEDIFMEACRTLSEGLERKRQPTNRGFDHAFDRPSLLRRVPAAVKRQVWARDGGKCAFVSPDGHRCESREALEYDHIIAWADGGPSDKAENIRLLCRAHNQRLGRKRFGLRKRKMR